MPRGNQLARQWALAMWGRPRATLDIDFLVMVDAKDLGLLRPRDPHDHQVFRRRVKKRLEGRVYWFVAPEDFILQKLKVGRPRDFEDTLTVLERSGARLNRAYLRRWAARLHITGELGYVLSL